MSSQFDCYDVTFVLIEERQHCVYENSDETITPLYNAAKSLNPNRIEAMTLLLNNGAKPKLLPEVFEGSIFYNLTFEQSFVELTLTEQKNVFNLLLDFGSVRGDAFSSVADHTLKYLNQEKQQQIIDLFFETGFEAREIDNFKLNVFEVAMTSGMIRPFIKHMDQNDYNSLSTDIKYNPKSLFLIKDQLEDEKISHLLFDSIVYSAQDEKSFIILLQKYVQIYGIESLKGLVSDALDFWISRKPYPGFINDNFFICISCFSDDFENFKRNLSTNTKRCLNLFMKYKNNSLDKIFCGKNRQIIYL